MAKDPKKPPKWPGLELAIVGEGLSPSDINVRHLAELLQAAASAVEAVAEEKGVEAPELRLIEVKEGSAAYDLTSPSPEATNVIRDLYDAAKTRGRQSSSKVCNAISRLHDASKLGSLRLLPHDLHGVSRVKAIHLAPPVEQSNVELDAGTETQGRVVGVIAGRGDSTTVRLRLDRGGTENFDATPEIGELAARLFNRRVTACVTYRLSHDTEIAGSIERVLPWDDADLFDVLRDVREEAEAEGIEIDVAAWLDELDAAVKD
jgi:hypothetical protein